MEDDPKPERVRTKVVLGAASAICGAVGGFLAGIATDQTNSYTARADDCYKSLTQYQGALLEVPSYAHSLGDPSVGAEKHNDAIRKWNSGAEAYAAVVNSCPITNPGHDYLNEADSKELVKVTTALNQCATEPPCTDDLMGLVNSTNAVLWKLRDQANLVRDWTVLDRAGYALSRLY